MRMLQFEQGCRKRWKSSCAALCMAFFFLFFFGLSGAEASTPPHILFLQAQTEEFPAHKLFENGFKKQMQAAGETKVEYSYTYLELLKFSANPKYPEQLASFLKQKYADKQPDLVVTHLGPAADFALKYGRGIFPAAQFMLAADEVEGVSEHELPPGFGGVTGTFNVQETIRLILKLQPDVRKIYVVLGDSEREQRTLAAFRQDVTTLSGQVEFVYFNKMSLSQMLATVGQVREKAAILYVFLFKDAAGNVFVPANEVKTFSVAANIPVYVPYAVFMGRGTVGGYVMSTEVLGMRAAELGLARLRSQGGASVPVSVQNVEYQFDWRELERWGIEESKLPAGSKILFREKTPWEEHRDFIIGVFAVIAVLSVLSGSLLVNWMRRRRAETELIGLNSALEDKVQQRTLALSITNAELRQKFEERQRTEAALRETNSYLENLINYANAPIIVWDPQFCITRFNHAFETITGRSEAEVLGQSLKILFPPALAASAMALIQKTLTGERWEAVEIVIIHRDESTRTVLWNSATLFAPESTIPIATIAQGQDITGRKEAEEAQQESERLLNLAQLVARVGYFSLDVKTGIWQGSAGLNSIFGIDETFPKDIAGWESLIVPEYRQILLKRLNRVISEGLRWEAEYKIIRADTGKERWISAQGDFDYDDSGNPLCLNGFLQDITDRKKLEVRQQRQRRILELLSQGASMQIILRTLLSGVEEDLPGSIPAIMLTDESKKQLFHTAYKKLPLFYVQAVDGLKIGPDASSCGRAAFIKQSVIDDDICEAPYWAELQEVAKKAGLGACWSDPILSDEGEVMGTFAVYFAKPCTPSAGDMELIRDVSHWAGIAVKNLRQQEELVKLSLAVEQSPAAVVITDLDGKITYVNRKFAEVSGYSFAEAIGKNPRILKTEETPPETFVELWRTIKAGCVWQGEFVNRKKNGEHYWEKALINPIHNEDGSVTHFLAIKEDITEFKRNQQALQLAKEEAESANRMKSAFVANISHEIRTPMNAIMGFTEILMRDSSLTNQQRQHLETIGRSGEHLLELINDVLEMSRIESGRSSLNSTEFDVRQVLFDLADMFRVKADEKLLHLSIEADPSVPFSLVTDKQKLRQILINLVSNAVKFTMEGKVTVRMWVEPVVDISGRLRMFIEVEDSGPGIAEEDLGKLFRPFTQTAGGRANGGTGLGLAISRNFARMMGGDIIATSTLGKGSCFQVEILTEPGRGKGLEHAGDLKVIGLAQGQRACRILIADDEELNRLLLVNVLEKVGFETRQASDGEQAFSIVAEWAPDLVLMDIQMPKIDGYECTRRINALAQEKKTLVVGLSAGAFEEDRKNALASGMEAFVTKPFKSQDLLHTIAHFLHVRYRYEESSVPMLRTGLDAAAMAVELEKVPRELIDTILESAGCADSVALMKAIDEVDPFSPALAFSLRGVVRRYDYEMCITMVERKAIQ